MNIQLIEQVVYHLMRSHWSSLLASPMNTRTYRISTKNFLAD